MRHLLLLVSIGFLFSQCASDQTSDTSVYDKHPDIASQNDPVDLAENINSESQAELEEKAAAEAEAIANAEAAELEKAQETQRQKELAVKAKKEEAARKAKANANAAAAKKKAAEAAARASTSSEKKDTRIRPTPKEERISTSIVSNPKTASSTPSRSVAKPVFRWVTKKHDFGWVNEGEKIKFSYHFTNVGNEPLIILEANADCGCTVPSYSKKPVPPGGRGSLDVIFDTKSKAGKQDKKITILANTVPNYTELTISGMVDNRPKKEEKSGTTTAPKSASTQPGAGAKSGGSLLDKLKNKVEKDGE